MVKMSMNMITHHGIRITKDDIGRFCKKHHITKFSFFGSYLRDDFGPESDIDVLVEFDPAHVPGLITIAAMEFELSEIIGRKVDIRTPEDLSRYFRQEVLRTAEVQYTLR
jgi:predicted nucleotidyltransferase